VILDDKDVVNQKQQVDLYALWRVLWDYKFFIGAVTLISVLIAAVVALRTTPVFRAETVITESRDSGMGGAASLVGQLGGLASLAGVNLGSMGGGTHQSQAVLESRHLVEEFVTRKQLLPVLLPEKTKYQTLWFAVRKFRDGVLALRQDARKGTTTVAVTWTDPVTAALWANDFVALANQELRDQAMGESRRNIAYLNEKLAQINSVEVQHAMYNLIESETKTLMLANGKVDYAFTVVDPATPPEVRFRPQRIVMVTIGGGVGLLIGTILAFMHRRMDWAGRKNRAGN
jgi:uncharacterized protein involved in exopolysaccharide biosynthesis